jgi:hypothetical protein
MKQNTWTSWILAPGIDLAKKYHFQRLHEHLDWHTLTIELVAAEGAKHSLKITIKDVLAYRKTILLTGADFLASDLHINDQLYTAKGAFHQVEGTASDFINVLYENSVRFYDADGFTHFVIITTTHLIEIAALCFNSKNLLVEKEESFNPGHATENDIKHMQQLEQALAQNPHDKEALLEKGILLYEPFQRTEEAIELLDHVSWLDPSNPETYFWLGKCFYEHNADYARARRMLEIAIAIDSTRADYLNLLASVLLKLEEPIEKIEAHFCRAIELDPTSIHLKKCLARILLNHGDFKRARAQLIEALGFVVSQSKNQQEELYVRNNLLTFLEEIDEEEATASEKTKTKKT